jgi:hypothetical protein
MTAWASSQNDSKQPDNSGSLNAVHAGEGASLESPRQTLIKPEQERRKGSRRRVLKGARIAFKACGAVIDCTVRNITDRGACLEVESPIGIPDYFDLVLDTAPVLKCRLTWRKAARIGVAFA